MTRKRGLPPPTRKGMKSVSTRKGTGITSKRKNAKSAVNKVRDLLYGTNKILGDIQAISTGKVAGRIERRLTGKIAAKGLGSNLFKFFQR